MEDNVLNEKQLVIKRLFQEGKITTDELILLSSSSSKLPQLPKSKQDVIKQLTNECVENFPVDRVINYMHQVNWKWALEEVNKETFTHQLRNLIERTVNQMFDYVRKHDEPLSSIEESFGIATGGIEVTGFFNKDGQPEIEVKFVAADSFAIYTDDDFSSIALNNETL